MSEVVRKRSEVLFCYDITNANPNGDPADSNKPRIDEESGRNIVTDVRLKRTIRDYFYNFKEMEIFVRETVAEKGGLKDGKARAKDFDGKEDILNQCVDIRLFGGVLPLEGDSYTFTGPVQFKMGKSLNQVEIKHIKGTGAFASKEGNKQNTFRDEYILPYSFIAFHGIINENAAKHTSLSEKDVPLLIEGMWEGTKNLISRSKFGQIPRLLIKINYREDAGGFFIGDLDNMICIDHENTSKIRNVSEFSLNISKLVEKISAADSKIESVEYRCNSDLRTTPEIPDSWRSI